MRKTHRVLIVDDHYVVRRGFAELINDEAALELCGEASCVTDALAVARKELPDLVITDLGLPDQNGLELIKRIESSSLKAKVLVSSIQDESLYAERCLRAGAMGYVNKSEPPERVLEAIYCVLDGDVFLSPHMTRKLLKGVAGKNDLTSSSVDRLTDRELEVFDQLGRGLSAREIAERMKLSIKTIETHRDKIKKKLKIESTSKLTRYAVQWVLEQG